MKNRMAVTRNMYRSKWPKNLELYKNFNGRLNKSRCQGTRVYKRFAEPKEDSSKKTTAKLAKKQTKNGEFDPILQSIANAEDPAAAYEMVKNNITDTRKEF